MIKFLNTEELEAGLLEILESPKDEGPLEMIVKRPNVDQREIIEFGEVTQTDGLLGDNWKNKGSSKTKDGSALMDVQLTIMNARCIQLLAQNKNRWSLAGDQLYVDMDLSEENLPIGSKLSIGSSIIEVTAIPHTGCKKFVQRFGKEAVIFVNSEIGIKNHLRGINAKVLKSGKFKTGDLVKKINP